MFSAHLPDLQELQFGCQQLPRDRAAGLAEYGGGQW
jgi:hypothetical protein